MAPVSTMETLYSFFFGVLYKTYSCCMTSSHISFSQLSIHKIKVFLAACLGFFLCHFREKKENLLVVGAGMYVKVCFTVGQKQKIDLQKSFGLFTLFFFHTVGSKLATAAVGQHCYFCSACVSCFVPCATSGEVVAHCKRMPLGCLCFVLACRFSLSLQEQPE